LDTDSDDTNSIQIEEHVTAKDNETQVEINNSSITPTNVINGDYIDSDYDDSWLASINDIMKEEFDNEET
jgi:protein-disulfide isomerase